jgi:hypothetical protein
MDAVVTRGGTPFFGCVGHVLGYMHQSQVILWFRDEPDRKLVAFPDVAVLMLMVLGLSCQWSSPGLIARCWS